MEILYYCWEENAALDILETFQSMGHSVSPFLHELSFYFSDEFKKNLQTELKRFHYDFIFTFNYFAPISAIAEQFNIPYVSWIFDCPNLEIYSTTISNSCNYLFLFDKNMVYTAIRNGARHAYHLPLAINTKRINQQLNISNNFCGFFPNEYLHDISFVGSLYEDGNFSKLSFLPAHYQGYIQGIIAAQKKIWGNDLISDVITEKRALDFSPYLTIDTPSNYTYTAREIYASLIQKRITSEERIEAITMLSQNNPFALYSNSSSTLCPNAKFMGNISYIDKMPHIFHQSKINLNITLRSITSGIPLRAIDVLGCGGFLLSNYQPELCEYFVPGEDFVYFEDFTDLQQKVAYYLSHDDEREQIAYNGYCKAQQNFSYHVQVSQIINTLK